MINNSIWVYANTANTLSFHMQDDTIPIISIPLALQIENLLCCQESLHGFGEINRNSAAEVWRNPEFFCSNVLVVYFSHSKWVKGGQFGSPLPEHFFIPHNYGSVGVHIDLDCINGFRNSYPFSPCWKKSRAEAVFFLSCMVMKKKKNIRI